MTVEQAKEMKTVSPEVLGIMQRAQVNAKTAQQMFQMTVNSVFEQYGLSPEDQIDIQTGKITKATPKPPA